MTESAAGALAKSEGLRWRVTSVDGEFRMVTRDYRMDRLNFEIVRGKVTRVTRG